MVEEDLNTAKPSASDMVDAQLTQFKLAGNVNISNRGKEKALETLRNFLHIQATKQMEKEGKVEPSLLQKLYEADVQLESFKEAKYSGAKGFLLKVGEASLSVGKKLGELGVKGGKGLAKAGAEVEAKKREAQAANPQAPNARQLFNGSTGSLWRGSTSPMAARNLNAVHSTSPHSLPPYISKKGSLWNV